MGNLALEIKKAELTDEQFKALVGTTITQVSAIGDALETARKTSEEVVLSWLPVYEMETDFKTGKADIRGFCAKIYSNFGELLVAQEKNPAKMKNYSTVSKEGYKALNSTPEQVKAANGIKAVEMWLKANIDNLFYEEVAVLDAEGKPELDKETGKPVTKHEPMFKAVVAAEEKALNKFLNELKDVRDSDYITSEEKRVLTEIFAKISARLVPELEKAKSEHAAKLEALKPQAEEVAEAV